MCPTQPTQLRSKHDAACRPAVTWLRHRPPHRHDEQQDAPAHRCGRRGRRARPAPLGSVRAVREGHAGRVDVEERPLRAGAARRRRRPARRQGQHAVERRHGRASHSSARRRDRSTRARRAERRRARIRSRARDCTLGRGHDALVLARAPSGRKAAWSRSRARCRCTRGRLRGSIDAEARGMNVPSNVATPARSRRCVR